MNQTIVESIRRRQRLRFTYNGKTRIVEPQCYGIGTRGTELMRAHQLKGGVQREPLFDVSRMTELVALDKFFTRPGPNYKRNDSAMKTIFSQL
jgi:predicted DNA-binding transcriptional regulator YafY